MARKAAGRGTGGWVGQASVRRSAAGGGSSGPGRAALQMLERPRHHRAPAPPSRPNRRRTVGEGRGADLVVRPQPHHHRARAGVEHHAQRSGNDDCERHVAAGVDRLLCALRDHVKAWGGAEVKGGFVGRGGGWGAASTAARQGAEPLWRQRARTVLLQPTGAGAPRLTVSAPPPRPPMNANTTAAAADMVPAKPRSGWRKGV
jgi:hypothetical protein